MRTQTKADVNRITFTGWTFILATNVIVWSMVYEIVLTAGRICQ